MVVIYLKKSIKRYTYQKKPFQMNYLSESDCASFKEINKTITQHLI